MRSERGVSEELLSFNGKRQDNVIRECVDFFGLLQPEHQNNRTMQPGCGDREYAASSTLHGILTRETPVKLLLAGASETPFRVAVHVAYTAYAGLDE